MCERQSLGLNEETHFYSPQRWRGGAREHLWSTFCCFPQTITFDLFWRGPKIFLSSLQWNTIIPLMELAKMLNLAISRSGEKDAGENESAAAAWT